MNKKDLKKLAKQGEIVIETVGFNLDDGTTVEFKVKKTIPIQERARFVRDVVGSLFVDELETVVDAETGEEQDVVVSKDSLYVPINREYLWGVYLLHYFAQCPLKDAEDAAILGRLADNDYVISRISQAVNSTILRQLSEAIDEAVAFKQMQLTAYGANELAKMNELMAVSMQYFQGDTFKGQMKTLSKDAAKAEKLAKGLNIIK